MDTRFSEEELAFHAEARDFSANVVDEELRALLDVAEVSPTRKDGMVEDALEGVEGALYWLTPQTDNICREWLWRDSETGGSSRSVCKRARIV